MQKHALSTRLYKGSIYFDAAKFSAREHHCLQFLKVATRNVSFKLMYIELQQWLPNSLSILHHSPFAYTDNTYTMTHNSGTGEIDLTADAGARERFRNFVRLIPLEWLQD